MAASDVEGIDEIVEQPHAVQLVFHIRRDWLAEADEAAQELAWKSDRCAAFLRSPDFRQRFGMKPGTILMKAARHPPGDVMAQLARIGADVEVGTIALGGAGAQPTVTCASCGRGGFVNAQMSMTERGLTCPSCFAVWNNAQLAQSPSGALSSGRSPGWIAMRIVIGVTLVVLLQALRWCH